MRSWRRNIVLVALAVGLYAGTNVTAFAMPVHMEVEVPGVEALQLPGGRPESEPSSVAAMLAWEANVKAAGLADNTQPVSSMEAMLAYCLQVVRAGATLAE